MTDIETILSTLRDYLSIEISEETELGYGGAAEHRLEVSLVLQDPRTGATETISSDFITTFRRDD